MTMVNKRVMASRAMVMRVVGDEEGNGNGDKRTVAAADSERRAVSGNGRRTAVATENAISIMPQFHRTLPPAPLLNNPDCCAI